jgi:nitrogen regulatory protein P-II 1
MKRIELVIDPVMLDRFTEAAKRLDLSEFDVSEVRRTLPANVRQRQRLYRGHEFVLDLVERLKIDLTVADDAAMQTAHALIESVCPESIAILRLDNPAVVTGQATARSSRIAVSNPSASVATH